MSRLFRIAIDGPGASGKSTTAKLLANKLGFGYIDSGAMFRAITLKCLERSVNLQNEKEVAQLTENASITFPQQGQVELDGHDVSESIRTSEVTRNTKFVASNPMVREILAQQQRAMAKGDIPGVVMDGRDIGTVILPDAELKVFIVADVKIRAQRRFDELKKKQGPSFKETLQGIQEDLEIRDLSDRTRKVAPLLQADDAVLLDTSLLTIEEQVGVIEKMVYERLSNFL
ncbi:cytidylate kinase [Mycotypha africana]|uniref:cytidylate kinase n=1 Tax=Mycotypha africana TaxID=64632 RepID=UPI002301D4A2|nr:cytidylate kinase [Mycotypha africana]KAI8971641.1 cytidylate kinase [Mycotypha africana]